MTAATNKAIITSAMDALSRGETLPFADAMADDFVWRMIGTTAWSGEFIGKDDVRGRLMKNLFGQFATPYRNKAKRILADGDFVVVECNGEVTTKSGKQYNNTYCYVIRMADGKMKELTEYMDTALVNDVLEAPDWA
jgi:ketosteroid isomerase-like protein